MAEKRSAHRIAVRLRASFRSSQAVIEGWVSDLSRGGLFLRTDYLDEPGSQGTVDLDLPGGDEPLRLPGAVVRVDTSPDRAGMAIRFDALPTEMRRPLANFMIETSYQALR
jgi:uncharacterized protein (TIGR02266 family)